MTRVKQIGFFFLLQLLELLQQVREGCHAARVPRRSLTKSVAELANSSLNFGLRTTGEPSPLVSPSDISAAPPGTAHAVEGEGNVAQSSPPGSPKDVPGPLQGKEILLVGDPQEQSGNHKAKATFSDESRTATSETETGGGNDAAEIPTAGASEEVPEQPGHVSDPDLAPSPPELDSSQQARHHPTDGNVSEGTSGAVTHREKKPSENTGKRYSRPVSTHINWPRFLTSNRLSLALGEGHEGSQSFPLQCEKVAVCKLAELTLCRAEDYEDRKRSLANQEGSGSADAFEKARLVSLDLLKKMCEEVEVTDPEEDESKTAAFLENALGLVKHLLSAPFISNPDSCVKTLPFIERHMGFRPYKPETVKIILDQLAISFLDIRAQADRVIRAMEASFARADQPEPSSSHTPRSGKGNAGAEGGGPTKWRLMLQKAKRAKGFSSPRGVMAEEPTGATATAPGCTTAGKFGDVRSGDPAPHSSGPGEGGDKGPTVAEPRRPAAGKPPGARQKRFSLHVFGFRAGEDSAGAASGTPGAVSIAKSSSEAPSDSKVGSGPSRSRSLRFPLRRTQSAETRAGTGDSSRVSGKGCFAKPRTKPAPRRTVSWVTPKSRTHSRRPEDLVDSQR